MKPLKPGLLVMCKRPPNPLHHPFVGSIRTVGQPVPGSGGQWSLEPPTMSGHLNLNWSAEHLIVLGDPDADLREIKPRELVLT